MIFDAHAHLPKGPGSTAALLATMDAAGIDRAVVIPGGTVSPAVLSRNMATGECVDATPDNARVAAAAGESGGRLVPFFFANPYAGAAHYAAEAPRFFGLKLGPAVHGVPFHDRRIVELVAVAAEHHHPVYLHTLARPGFTVVDAMVLAARFPSVPLIVGHAAGGHCEFHALDAIAEVPNALLETSGGFTSFVAASLARLGEKRVLFGSEYPLQHPRAEIAKLECLDLPASARAAVFGGNILRLLSSSLSRRLEAS
jgi:predicted TIM-barrel fold metal-dependent hydrolase